MTSRVEMPALGENVTEGLITRWLKKVGDTVGKDEPLLEVATDKVDTEIPAPFAGTVEQLLAEENSTVSVGEPLAVITPVAVSGAVSVPSPQVVSAPPASAPKPAKAAPVPGPKAVSEPPATAPEQAEPAAPPTPVPNSSDPRVEKMSRLRQTIAKRMVESLQNSAQLTTVLEADVTKLAQLRARSKDEFHRRTGTKLSFLPFFAKAIVEALKEYPMFNASVSPDHTEVTYHAARNLGIAVDTPRGLLVPVIRDADELSIADIALTIADLADRTRSGKISADELTGGTFTLTNTGSRGALFDTPIINQPQSGIVGTGAVVDRVVPMPDGLGGHSFAVRSMVYLSVSYDHRLVDGADAARFLTTIKNRVEHADFDTEL
ncbi:2-oxo acid dehydrogenase subunit E2 [Saccharopolyspora pogona]|uniref:2-oxo acid dehydrogenase subunit E2 n=1 Tax=Saccharopolyspora pogona TaxID=333966 RepID=UPI001685C356|nr:2-oxo acid dehydrogenase subunit E2 [Saccharopolyspora pogona]